MEREKKAWSQDQLAEKIYVSRQSVSKWETGKNYPSIEMIIKLSDLFNITIDELLKKEKVVYVMSKIRLSLLFVLSIFVITSLFVTDSLTAFLAGIAGLVGIATWGYSSKEVVEIVKSKFNFQS